MVAVKRVHHDLERAIFLSAPHNDGLALFCQSSLPHQQEDQGLCTRRLDRHGGAPDFDDEVTGLDDIDGLEIKSLHPPSIIFCWAVWMAARPSTMGAPGG